MDFYYEILLITIPTKAISTEVDKKIRNIFPKIIKYESWGVKKFAYKIKKHESGIYLCYYVKAGAEELEKFRYEAKVNTDILRFLLLNLHKHTKDPKKYIDKKLKMELTEEEIELELVFREKLSKIRKKRLSNISSNIKNNIT